MRDVGTRHLTDIEAVARLLELLGKDLDIALVELKDRAVAQQVHVGGRSVEQHLLLGHPQRLARGVDLAFCLAGLIGSLKAVKERLACSGPEGARVKCLTEVNLPWLRLRPGTAASSWYNYIRRSP